MTERQIGERLRRAADSRKVRIRPLQGIERRARVLKRRTRIARIATATVVAAATAVAAPAVLEALDTGTREAPPVGTTNTESPAPEPCRIAHPDQDESPGLCGSFWLRSVVSDAGLDYNTVGELIVYRNGDPAFFIFVERPVYEDPLREAKNPGAGPVDPQSPLWEHGGTTIYSTWDGRSKENLASFYFRAGGVDIHPGGDVALPDDAPALQVTFESIIDVANADPYDPADLPRFLPADSDRWLDSIAKPLRLHTCRFDDDYRGRCYLLEAQLEARDDKGGLIFQAWGAKPAEADPAFVAEDNGMTPLWTHGETTIYSEPLGRQSPGTVRLYWRAGGVDVWTEAFFPPVNGAASMEGVRQAFEVMIDEANRRPYAGG